MLPFDYRNALIISLAAMTICLSYVVITGFVGQVSLMQVALAGASGFVVSHLVKDAGIGFPLARHRRRRWSRPCWASWPAPRRCACAASAWRW